MAIASTKRGKSRLNPPASSGDEPEDQGRALEPRLREEERQEGTSNEWAAAPWPNTPRW
jgi:hypothetical protein